LPNSLGGILMITIKGREESYSLRFAGIFIHNDKILLQNATKPEAWESPCGKSEINETSGEVLIREIKKEFGVGRK
jgi:8-oxo-dGTP pyrophosphatase MutT (NUDIX family)